MDMSALPSIYKTQQAILPIDGEEYNIRDLKVVYHNIPDKKGVLRRVKCVEFVVVGNYHEWKNWAMYSEFFQIKQNECLNVIEES